MKFSSLTLFSILVTLALCSNTPENYRVPGAVISGGMYMPTIIALSQCKDNSTCTGKTEIMKKVNNDESKVCCGWAQYDKNGVPQQTSSRCLFVDDFEKYYIEVSNIKNMESISVGCQLGDASDLNNFAYSGPES